jgi:hypothetical protein
LSCASVFSPLACLEVPNGLSAASTCYGKIYFHPNLLEPHDSPSFNTAKIRPQNKPKSNAKRQKKNKNLFSQFRNKHARFAGGLIPGRV